MRRRSLLGAWIAAAVLAGCDRGAGPPPAVLAAPPPVDALVGPLPGEGDVAPAVNPFAGNAQVATGGRHLFVAFNCAGCHGGHAGGGMGPSLRDPVWLYGGTDGAIFDSIAKGRANGMPGWGTLLPAQQIWMLTTYIRSLRTPGEPDPPQW
jgi:cytochrome c oxidase cbb3-type subunit 3